MFRILQYLSISIAALFFASCSASVQFTPSTDTRPPRPDNFDIRIYQISDTVQVKHTVLGLITVDDSGFTTNCSKEVVINDAVMRARSVGADAIKFVQIDSPDLWSSCYRIVVLAIAYD